MLVRDFMLAANILLSGGNYPKGDLLFKFMNIGMVDHSSFYTVRDTCCVDTIKEYWNERRIEIIQHLQSMDVVIIGNMHIILCCCFVRYQWYVGMYVSQKSPSDLHDQNVSQSGGAMVASKALRVHARIYFSQFLI